MSIRIIIAEDNDILREDLRCELNREPDLEVVADVATGAAAVQAALELEFDVILLDPPYHSDLLEKCIEAVLK